MRSSASGMRVYVLGSGSSGNALLVESSGTRLLVEAGVGPKVAASRLAELGVELGARELDGIVATHRHGDHFGHAGKLATAFSAPLYLHPGIDGVEPAASVEVRRYDIGRAFRVGALTITTVQVPHDAAQVALRVDDGTHALGIATDVGRVTSGLVGLLGACDAALVEANHCSEMLAFSEYPDVVKRRIGGGWGHLSNAQTAELGARLVGSRLARLWLGHLSRSNNTPARALETVASRARGIDVDVIPEASPVALDVRTTRPHQLGLPF
ncbi:MAG: MBL fold metallo-hydrolase [Labilithrix sp.]|nr:MBL fold metallo-hydrolase [Labilithrix sp.]